MDGPQFFERIREIENENKVKIDVHGIKSVFDLDGKESEAYTCTISKGWRVFKTLTDKAAADSRGGEVLLWDICAACGSIERSEQLES